MTCVTVFEAKTRFGELLERVAGGEEIIITRHNMPVARMVPEGRHSTEQIARTVEALARLRGRITARGGNKKPFSVAEVRSAVEQGRRRAIAGSSTRL